MATAISRRSVLRYAVASAAGAALLDPRAGALANGGLRLGVPKPFSFDALITRARALAAASYVPPARPAPDLVQRLDYEDHGKISYRREHALFAAEREAGCYPATFFHLGRFFSATVKMHAVEGATAREIGYSPDLFDMPADSPARGLPGNAGFAGFRLHEAESRADWRTQDWVAFLGASYFRSIGALNQYGASARGIAVDVAAPSPEEFPNFTEFYIAPALSEGDPVVVHALLDGPSITGAYRFEIRRTAGCLMEIDAALFTRRPVHRLGVAPLTSMFWYGEHDRPAGTDWRPEIHDSDGLALWTGSGERLWRPLNNPKRVVTSSFADDNPRGFGLLQRDRNVENYLDGVAYERRPSLWVEPLGDWGRGQVQLVEIPTDDEIHDNIVAFWVPEEPVQAGADFRYRYRLHWDADEPSPPGARAISTRVGRGGEPGRPRPRGVTKFVVDFEGPSLERLARGAKPRAVVSASRGTVSNIFTEPVPSTRRWRAVFDLVLPEGTDPAELRAFLTYGDAALSETWAYQHHPRIGTPA